MKTTTIILGIAFCSVLSFSSCVSSKKYNEAVSKVSDRDKQIEQLQKEKNDLEAQAAEANRNHMKALQDKDQALSDEQRKMQELKSLVDEEQDAIRSGVG